MAKGSEIEKEGEFFICTREHPWRPDIPVPTEHPEAFVLYEGTHMDMPMPVYFCPLCQRTFCSTKPR